MAKFVLRDSITSSRSRERKFARAARLSACDRFQEIVDGDSMLPNANSPVIGYLIAAVAGALIATLMYYYKIGA